MSTAARAAVPVEERYANKLFLNSVLPLLKVIVADVPSLSSKFAHTTGVVQISARDPEAEGGKSATYFVIEQGVWTVFNDQVSPSPDVELEFKSIPAMNAFFKGKMIPLPAMHGMFSHFSLFLHFMQALLKMSGLLGAKEPPKSLEDRKLMVKCFFYLLTSGISQLNKLGHPEVLAWSKNSPDRVYALAIENEPDVAAYIRIKAGKSRAGRGKYTRALPFFTLSFDSFDSALGILLGTDDMIASTKSGKLIMDGAPEFGATFGNLLLAVGGYVQ